MCPVVITESSQQPPEDTEAQRGSVTSLRSHRKWSGRTLTQVHASKPRTRALGPLVP